jgi:hypothetical protein
MWLPAHDAPPQWTPVPPQLLKLGKIAYGDVPLSSEKSAMFALGLAQSFGGVHRETPILGPFLAMYDRLGVTPDSKVTRALATLRRYGIELPKDQDSVSQPSPDVPAIERLFCERYSITREDIARVEAGFRRVPCLPFFFGDDVFTALSQDYR